MDAIDAFYQSSLTYYWAKVEGQYVFWSSREKNNETREHAAIRNKLYSMLDNTYGPQWDFGQYYMAHYLYREEHSEPEEQAD